MSIRPAFARLLLAAAIGPCGIVGTVAAQNVVTTATRQPAATEAVGSRYRAHVDRAQGLVRDGDLARAFEEIGPALAYCDEQLARTGLRFVSVIDATEYQAYLDAHPAGAPTEWLDIACANAYTLAGFIHAGERRLEAAMPYLDRAIAIAPYLPDPRTEKGFVLNQLGRHEEAIEVYREVIALADRHASASHMKGMALRGIGWAMVEQGDLDAARASYEASLVAEPGNRTALNELEYIARQGAGAAGSGE